MNKKRSDWSLPEEVLGLLSTVYLLPAIAMVGCLLMPLIPSLQHVDVTRLFWIGLAAGTAGAALLFFARLPLYRQRRFLTFGPRDLDQFHRRLYWLAYLFVVAGVSLLLIVWFSVK